MSDTKAARLSKLCDEIGYALGRGEFPEDQIREFRWLWRTSPDQEKDGLSYTLQDIEKMVKEMRQELSANNSGAGKLMSTKISYGAVTGASICDSQ